MQWKLKLFFVISTRSRIVIGKWWLCIKKSWRRIFAARWNMAWAFLAANGNRVLYACWRKKINCVIVNCARNWLILPMLFWRRRLKSWLQTIWWRARLIMKSRRMWSMSLRKRELRLYLYYKVFAVGRGYFARKLTSWCWRSASVVTISKVIYTANKNLR